MKILVVEDDLALSAGLCFELDAGGYVAAGETTETSLPGVYAAGDVRTKPLRQVVTAVADGAMAVYMAEEYLAGGVPAARSPAGT